MICMVGSELGHGEFLATFENFIQIKGKQIIYKCLPSLLCESNWNNGQKELAKCGGIQ